MRSTILTCAALATLSFGVSDVMAYPVITPSTPALATGTETSQAAINVAIGPIMGLTPASDYQLYKQDVGVASDVGAAAPYYKTTFSNSANDPANALIEWLGGNFIGSAAKYLLVKDGNHNPAWYLFNISDWNGQDDLVMEGFWPQQGAISHVTIYGDNGDNPDLVTEVPEPASIGLWLTVVAGSAFAARRRRSAC